MSTTETVASDSDYSTLQAEDEHQHHQDGFMLTGNNFGYRGSRFPPFVKRGLCCGEVELPRRPKLLEGANIAWENFSEDTTKILTQKYRYTFGLFIAQLTVLYFLPWTLVGGIPPWYPLVLMILELLFFYYIIVLECPMLDICLRTRTRLLEIEELYIPLFASSGVKLSYVLEQVPSWCGLGVASITYWSFQKQEQTRRPICSVDL